MARHERDQHAERDALREADGVIYDRHGGRQLLDEVAHRQVQFDLRRDHAADQGHRIRPHDEQRHRQRERDHLGHDEAVAVRDAHHEHRVEFLRHAHHAQLRRDRRPGAARDEDRRQQRTEFADDAHAEDVDEVDVAAEHAQLLRRQVRQHDPDQEAHERRDAERLEAGVIDVGRDFAPRSGQRMADEAADVLHHLADQGDRAAQVLEETQYAAAQRDHPLQMALAGARQLDLAGFLDAFEEFFLLRVELQLLGAALAPGTPEQLGADVIEAGDLGQVPGDRLAGQGFQRLFDVLEAAPGECVDLPYAARHHGLPRAGVWMLDG